MLHRSHSVLQTASTSAVVQEETGEMYKRRTEALQNVAFSPVKQVLMMSFMMYMTGTRLHFFSILTVINGIYSPLSAILRSKSCTCSSQIIPFRCSPELAYMLDTLLSFPLSAAFKSIPGSKVDVVLPHIMFCMIHFGGLVFALYRMHLMGLFPTHVSDWLSLISSPGISEQAVGLL